MHLLFRSPPLCLNCVSLAPYQQQLSAHPQAGHGFVIWLSLQTDSCSDGEVLPLQGISFVVDNTFSPLIISPAKWGADVVVHSMTKFMSGASDIVAGKPAFMLRFAMLEIACAVHNVQCLNGIHQTART